MSLSLGEVLSRHIKMYGLGEGLGSLGAGIMIMNEPAQSWKKWDRSEESKFKSLLLADVTIKLWAIHCPAPSLGFLI